jgi:hypothetical protein
VKQAPTQTSRESDFSWRAMLLARPLRNAAAQAEWNAEGTRFEIVVPTRRDRRLISPISWFVRPPKFRTMALDSIGVMVWKMCDGSHTVEAVIERVAEQYRLTFHESRVSVVAFFRGLLERGAIVMIAETAGEAAGTGMKVHEKSAMLNGKRKDGLA